MAVERGLQLTGLELYRPVLDGAGRVLNKIRFRGANVFGDDGTTADLDIYRREDALAEGEESYSPDPSNRVLRQIGNPRFKVKDLEDLRMGLYNVYVPAHEPHGLYLISKTAETVLPSPNPRYKAVKEPPQGIKPELFRAGLKYDVPRQDELRMWFADLAIRPNLVTGKSELVLKPDMTTPEAQMSMEQAEICRRGILGVSSKFQRKIVLEGNGLGITVAILADDTTPVERKKIDEQVGELLPVPIVMGGIEKEITHRSSIGLG